MDELITRGKNETFFVGPSSFLIGSDDVTESIVLDSSALLQQLSWDPVDLIQVDGVDPVSVRDLLVDVVAVFFSRW